MKYLLLGNGVIDPGGPILNADCVVQFNRCLHRARVAMAAQRYVFISNTGTPTATCVEFLLAQRDDPALAGATMMRARNPAFYRLKQALLRAGGVFGWQDYDLSRAMDRLAPHWRIGTIGFAATARLEFYLRRHGMAHGMMPSTGMVALDWVRRRMRPGDTVELAGFSWEGWERHPWQIERRLMATIPRRA